MKFLIAADVKGWAFWHMATGIAKYSSYQCELCDSAGLGVLMSDNPELDGYAGVLQLGFAEGNTSIPIRSASLLDHAGWMYSKNENSYLSSRLTTGLRNLEKSSLIDYYDAILVKNDSLFRFFNGRHKNVKRVRVGYDPDVFYRLPLNTSKTLTVGWCGQRLTLNQKGHDEVLMKVMNKVQRDVEWKINDVSYMNALTPDEMREWYRGIDLFLCTSCAEGGPMPPLEALACNRNVISTPVGFMGELPIQTTSSTWNSEESASSVAMEIAQMIDGYNRSDAPLTNEWSWESLADSWVESCFE